MTIEVLKSKIHRVRVTEANLNYVGSVSIDENLMNAANLIENEAVHVLNYSNGERFITYVIKAERGSGTICLNGPASHKVSVGDHVIILSYAQMDFEKAKTFSPTVIFPDPSTNRIK
jgi:aspartate 1-decarboxylase